MYVKATFRAGHVGAGKYLEMTRYLKVRNPVNALDISKRLPKVKKNNMALVNCIKITEIEYSRG